MAITGSPFLEQARSLTQQLLRTAADHYGIARPRPELRFDLRGLAAGQVRFLPRGTAIIRYNPQLLAENGNAFLARTVPHEVAHLIARRVFGSRIRPHGQEWQAVMELFKADASRCHSYDTSRARTRRLTQFPYHCACRSHLLTSIRHHRVLAGQRYLCRTCGEALQPGGLDRPS
jgi:SprT protein